MKRTLGDIIKAFRKENNMSMDDFAKISNLSKGYISMLEKNENPRNKKPITPSLDTYKSVAKALNTDIDTLLNMIDSDEPIRISININNNNLSSQDTSDLDEELLVLARNAKTLTKDQLQAIKRTIDAFKKSNED